MGPVERTIRCLTTLWTQYTLAAALIVAATVPGCAQNPSDQPTGDRQKQTESADAPDKGTPQSPNEQVAPLTSAQTDSAAGSKTVARTAPAAQPPAKTDRNKATVTVPAASANDELDPELVANATALLKEAAEYVKQQRKPKGLIDTLLDFFSRLAALVGAVLGAVVIYKGLRSTSFWDANKEWIVSVLAAIVIGVLLYFLSGIVVSVVYVLVAALVLTIILAVSGVYLLRTIDELFPDKKYDVLSFFVKPKGSFKQDRLAKKILNNTHQWLDAVLNFQKLLMGNTRLNLWARSYRTATKRRFLCSRRQTRDLVGTRSKTACWFPLTLM